MSVLDMQVVEKYIDCTKCLIEKHGEKYKIKHITGLACLLHHLGDNYERIANYIFKAVMNNDSNSENVDLNAHLMNSQMIREDYKQSKDFVHVMLLTELIGSAIVDHHAYLKENVPSNMTSPYLAWIGDHFSACPLLSKRSFHKEIMTKEDFHLYVLKGMNELKDFISQTTIDDRENQLKYLSETILNALIDGDYINKI